MDEYLTQWVDMLKRTDLRMGQAAFNTLASVDPDLADRITARWRDLDPYFDDSNVPAFLLAISKEWSQ